MEFPERVFTVKEVEKAKELIEGGYKHRFKIRGSPEFKRQAKEALKLIKTARHYEFLRTYIKQIVEVDGFSQLREAEAAIWANKYAVEDPVDAAGLFVQKAHQMKEYIEGKIYYGGEAEKRAVEKRIEFLKELQKRSQRDDIKEKCEEYVKRWTETVFP